MKSADWLESLFDFREKSELNVSAGLSTYRTSNVKRKNQRRLNEKASGIEKLLIKILVDVSQQVDMAKAKHE